jgi:threonine dehydrogenase-like Zn-dependent dehydrogenase
MAEHMWAQVLVGPGRFDRVDLPLPAQPGPGQVLLRTVAGGLCGSDRPYFLGAPNPFRRAPGPAYGDVGFPLHEVVGEVVTSRDPSLPPGALAVGWATGFDGLAEYVVTDAESLWAFDPATVDPVDAVLLQPLACVLYAVERLGDVSGLDCAVLGLGSIGLLFASVLTARGAASVAGVDRVDRSAAAGKVGVSDVAWSDSETWSAESAHSAAYPVVVEAVGHQTLTLQHALDAVGERGRVFYFGVPDETTYPIDMYTMVRKHLTLFAGGTFERRRMLREAGDHLAARRYLTETLISHRFAMSDAQAAYDLAFRSPTDRLKVVLTAT